MGCGWLGFPLAVHLINKGFIIKGSTTSKSKLSRLKSKGIVPYFIHLNGVDAKISEFLHSDVLIVNIPSKNIDDFKKFISRIKVSNIKKVLFISSTSVYVNSNKIVTEESPVKKSDLTDIETLFKSNAAFETTILRFGGLYGYDRKPGNFIKPGNKIENPQGYINLIHRDDCIQIIKQIIIQNIWGETLNACTDSHPVRRDFYKRQMVELGKEEPMFNENSTNFYKIVNSNKLKTLLGYRFKYSEL